MLCTFTLFVCLEVHISYWLVCSWRIAIYKTSLVLAVSKEGTCFLMFVEAKEVFGSFSLTVIVQLSVLFGTGLTLF
jgi:hypothetical protein